MNRFLPVLLLLVAGIFSGRAQPDYAAAHWVPPACTKWYTTGNGHSFVVIHDMEGYYQDTISYLNRCDLDTNGDYNVAVSVYYAVNSLQNGNDTHSHHENNPGDVAIGDITQFVRESNYAWHARCWNTYMFGTEHEGFVNDPAWYTPGMYQASAGLQRHLCEKYNIAKDRNHVIGHNEHLNTTWTNWVVTNGWTFDPVCNDHTDPGQYWNWTYFMSLINADTNLTGVYWDTNGSTNGAGKTPSGTWGLSKSNWTSNPSGTSKPGLWINTADAIFSAGTDATNAYTVTISGTQTVYSVQVLTGNPTFTGGGLAFTGFGTYYTNYVAAGSTATFNTSFAGTGAPDKWGPGTAVYNSPALIMNTGYMTLNEGAIAVGDDAAFGPNKFYIGEPTGVNVVTLKSANATAHTLANNFIIYATSFILDTNGNLTFSGPVDLRTTIHTITVNNTNSTFSGILTNTGGIIKSGAGTLTFSGANANSYSGLTTVKNGTLNLNKTPGIAAITATGILLTNTGVLLLSASNQMADTAPMTLGGGTFKTAGFNEQLGTLKLTANSVIDLGVGASVIKFAASSGVTWAAATTLTITNWNGSINGGAGDQLFVGTSSTGLSSGQLAQIKFANPPGFDPGLYAAKILSSGEVVPVAVAPTVATQPKTQTVLAGTNVTFTVGMNGTTPMVYQWRRSGTNVSGAIGSILILTNVAVGQSGSYSVAVTNIAGSVTSGPAILTVYSNAIPRFTAPGMTGNGQFSFSLSGVPGWNYIVQSSSNLSSWTSLQTNPSPFNFTTNTATAPFQFYRAVYAP